MAAALKLGIPKGSLETSTLDVFARVGLRFGGTSRTLWLDSSDPEIEPILLKPQEIPLYVRDGRLDAGLSGLDWLVEQDVLPHVKRLAELPFSRQTPTPLRWVLAVPQESPVRNLPGLRLACEEKRQAGSSFVISTELVNTSRMWLARNGVDAVVERSWGATEAKGRYFADAIIEGTETGTSLRANQLREIAEIISSQNIFFANRAIMESIGSWKQKKLVGMGNMIEAALRAVTHVELHVISRKGDEISWPVLVNAKVLRSEDDGYETLRAVIPSIDVPNLLPAIIEAGAEDAWVSPISVYYSRGASDASWS